jgi:hypothetical protein
MKSLIQPGPFTIEIVAGLTVTCRPRSLIDYVIAQAAATRRVDRLEESQADVVEAGILPAGMVDDLANPDQRNALFKVLLIDELAIRHITAWTGVEDPAGGRPAAVTAANIRQLMNRWPDGAALPLGELFFARFTAGIQEMLNAKKDSGTAAPGISATVPAIATDAAAKGFPAPKGSGA